MPATFVPCAQSLYGVAYEQLTPEPAAVEFAARPGQKLVPPPAPLAFE